MLPKALSGLFNKVPRAILIGMLLILSLFNTVRAGDSEMKPDMLETHLREEVMALHDFFVGWYNASLPESAFDTEFMARLDNDFTIIMPSGVKLDHKTLVSSMRSSYGKKPGFRIEIRNVRLLQAKGSIAVAQYEEWQHNKQESPSVGSGRISTVIFSLGDKLQWLHVHETWLPEDLVQADGFDF